MGLISGEVDGETQYVALTDILGAEDAFGDMDFKVAGTREFVTALQLDTKLDGIPAEVLAAALTQARDARHTILDVMAEEIAGPEEMSPTAPRIITIKVPVDKIGEVIGPKGKIINQIQDDTGATLSIEDDGTVYIGATNGEAAEAAKTAVNAIANPTMPEVGERYLGTVVKTTNFGAFVSLMPGKDGLLHISKLRPLAGGKRVEAVEDVVSVGQKIQVEIAEIDDRGKLSLVPVVEDDRGRARRAPTGRRGRGTTSGRGLTLRSTPATRDPADGRDGGGRVTSLVRRTVLPSGLRVITEQLAGVRSASIGVWVGVGSRDETATLHGCSHFLEHLLFKGTSERSALDISIALDAVGGEFNAFTAKEYTCFHARVLDEDLPLAVDVLGDMVTSSLLTAEDVEAERDVILDEIAMHDDDPDDVVHNLFAEQAWGSGTPLGRLDRRHRRLDRGAEPGPGAALLPAPLPARRTWSSPRPATSTTPRSYAACARAFGRAGLLSGDEPTRSRRARRGHAGPRAPRRWSRRSARSSRSTSCSAWRACDRNDDRRFALGVLNTALGGGTSSRLFQEVRERRGLAYSVFSFASHHADSGLVGVSVGCLPNKLDDVLAVVRTELSRVAAHGITAEELVRGKGQLRGGLVLGLEDSGSRMSRIGKAELVHDELLGIDDGDGADRRGHPRRGPGRRRRGLRPARDPRGRRAVLIPP